MSCSVYSAIVNPPIPCSYCSLLIEPDKHGCITFRASGALHRWIKEHSLDTAHFHHLCFTAAERARFKLLHCHRLHPSAAEETFRQIYLSSADQLLRIRQRLYPVAQRMPLVEPMVTPRAVYVAQHRVVQIPRPSLVVAGRQELYHLPPTIFVFCAQKTISCRV